MSSPDPAPSTTPRDPAVLSAAQAKRMRSSITGLLIALAVTLAVIIPVLLFSPGQRAETYRPAVDVSGIAAQAAAAAGFRPVSVMPPGWSANYARFNAGTTTGVPNWEVGYVSGDQQFIALTQAAARRANPTWVAQVTDNAPVTSDRTVAGQRFELRDKAGTKSLIATIGGSTVVLRGQASDAALTTLAAAVVDDLRGNGTSTPSGTTTGTSSTPAASPSSSPTP
ncbi:DUF4245 domain-containing protein [Tersicoccus sp. Bi-70]|uniref:DUF4245 domain-containing protein n=1 Tax=Tersicoccus sp. Bi-70 TaxID=1897634 RepID=UPI00130168F0|nr:DUF4245 domain-containing protein [Tersicoccus sp. Bi-70]